MKCAMSMWLLLSLVASTSDPNLISIRATTERFQDVQVALAEGYVKAPGGACKTAAHMGRLASLGSMGVHYFRPDLLDITASPSF